MVTRITFRLKYGVGKQLLHVTARNFLELVEPQLPPVPEKSPHDMVREAVRTCGWFFQRERKNIAIVVPDITRYCAAEVMLPAILGELSRVGAGAGKVTIVFANGLHRKHSEDERRRIVGEEVFSKVACVDHDPDADDVVRVGDLPDGTPVELNRAVAEADGVVVTGAISIHYLAGFGGGGKTLAPGVASRRTIVGLHRLTLDPVAGSGRDRRVRAGLLDGNPFRSAIDDAAAFVKEALLVNTILAPDHRLLQVVAGRMQNAFAEGVKAFSKIYVRPCREYANLVVVSSGGFPRDINFIQAHKAIDHASCVLEEGGVMLVLARCQDGLGSPDMEKWFRFKDILQMEAALRENFEVYGQTAYATRQKAQRFKIVLLSELPRNVVEQMGVMPISSLHELDDVIEDFVTRYPKVYVIPDGAGVLPVVAESGGASEQVSK